MTPSLRDLYYRLALIIDTLEQCERATSLHRATLHGLVRTVPMKSRAILRDLIDGLAITATELDLTILTLGQIKRAVAPRRRMKKKSR